MRDIFVPPAGRFTGYDIASYRDGFSLAAIEE